MKLGTLLALALSVPLAAVACSAAPVDDDVGSSGEDLSTVSSFVARGTGYYPSSSALEGGFTDRRGKPLHTLQAFLAGNASDVSVAMDANAFKYGQRLRIHELETKYGRSIPFSVVDTGGAFVGKGTSRIDICTSSNAASLDKTINGTLHIDVVNATSSAAPAPAPTTAPAPTAAPAPAPAPSTGSSSGSSSGATCHSHGDCNPGNDGSGMICVGGQCVPGCTADWECPGSTTCVGGQCN